MESISISVKELKDVMAQVKIVEDKSAGVFYEYGLIRDDNGTCTLSVATPTGLYTQELQCGSPQKPFLVYFPILKGIIAQVKTGVCHIYADKVVSGGIELLNTSGTEVKVEDFPADSIKIVNPVDITLKDISVLRQVYFSTKGESRLGRYNADGIYFNLEDSVLELVQTDGVRLVRVKVPMAEDTQKVSFLCPHSICRFLSKQKGEVIIKVSEGAAEVKSLSNRWSYVFKYTQGNYPNYRAVLDRPESNAIVKLDLKHVLPKIRNCRDDVIVISVSNNQALASSKSTKLGVIGTDTVGKEVEVKVVRENLVKLLGLLDPYKPVLLYLTAPKEPLFIAPEGSSYWLGAMSPVYP